MRRGGQPDCDRRQPAAPCSSELQTVDLQDGSCLLRSLNGLGCSSAALPIPVGAVAGRPPRVKVSTMISVLVTFQYGDDFDHERVAKVAAEARTMFEGMPG